MNDALQSQSESSAEPWEFAGWGRAERIADLAHGRPASAARSAAQAHARHLARHRDLRQRHHVERPLRLGALRGAGRCARPARPADRGRRPLPLSQGLRRGRERAAAERRHLHRAAQHDEQAGRRGRSLPHAAVLHRDGRHQRQRGDALRPPPLAGASTSSRRRWGSSRSSRFLGIIGISESAIVALGIFVLPPGDAHAADAWPAASSWCSDPTLLHRELAPAERPEPAARALLRLRRGDARHQRLRELGQLHRGAEGGRLPEDAAQHVDRRRDLQSGDQPALARAAAARADPGGAARPAGADGRGGASDVRWRCS